jgi:hypothetical protein
VGGEYSRPDDVNVEEVLVNRKQLPAYDPNTVYDGETAAFVRNVRLVCGGLFGLVPGLWISAYLGAPGGAVLC